MGLSLEDIADRLGVYFEGRKDVLLAFVFGSAMAGRLTEESDIDVAVLFSGTPAFSDVHRMTAEVSEALGRDADIVVLNGSSPVIRMQVLKHGKQTAGGGDEYARFFAKTVKEYDDLKYFRKEAEEKILRGRIYA
jgi:hypothetical protein